MVYMFQNSYTNSRISWFEFLRNFLTHPTQKDETTKIAVWLGSKTFHLPVLLILLNTADFLVLLITAKFMILQPPPKFTFEDVCGAFAYHLEEELPNFLCDLAILNKFNSTHTVESV
jgi:hypothetical protein